MKLSKTWFVSLLLLPACSDYTHESPVPAGRVRYSCVLATVNAYMQQNTGQISLENPCGYVRLYDYTLRAGTDSWGTGGLLLVHGYDLSTYYAYDLACPQCYATAASSRLHQIEIDSTGFTAICTQCESAFGAIFWGSPAATAGPANRNNYPLRQYQATQVGDRLIVTN